MWLRIQIISTVSTDQNRIFFCGWKYLRVLRDVDVYRYWILNFVSIEEVWNSSFNMFMENWTIVSEKLEDYVRGIIYDDDNELKM